MKNNNKTNFLILAINPGSTSTKIGLFENENKLWDINVHHNPNEFNNLKNVEQQIEFRKQAILAELKKRNINLKNIDIFAPRGGFSNSIEGGTYLVTKELCEAQKDFHDKIRHPTNLACSIAFSLASEFDKPIYTTDSGFTYELSKLASYSGSKEIFRPGRFHALNQKSIARQHCKIHNLDYWKTNLIVCHMGGGITVGAHHNGRVIDVNDAVSEGPFTPERTGSLPVKKILEICFEKSPDVARKMVQGQGGLMSYLNDNDFKKLIEEIDNNTEIKLVIDAMIYQIAQEIGKRAVNLKGKVNSIIFTGGMSHNKYLIEQLSNYTDWISKIYVYPGEFELEALAAGALRVALNKEQPKLITDLAFELKA